jgi:hypothetical protein
MGSRSPHTLPAALRRLLTQRPILPTEGQRMRRQAAANPRDPSSIVIHGELESFRRAQAASYWHYDHRST